MTNEEIIEGLKLLEDNMVYFDELQNDKGEWIDVHELLFESIEALSAEPCDDSISRAEAMTEVMMFAGNVKSDEEDVYIKVSDVVQLLRELPSATPKPKPDFEDYISRDSLKHKLQEHHDFFVNAYGGFSNLPQNDKSRVDEITNCIAMVVNEPPVTPKPKTDVFNKIRAEIEFIPTIEWKDDGTTYILASYFKKQVLEIIDKYKADSEEV